MVLKHCNHINLLLAVVQIVLVPFFLDCFPYCGFTTELTWSLINLGCALLLIIGITIKKPALYFPNILFNSTITIIFIMDIFDSIGNNKTATEILSDAAIPAYASFSFIANIFLFSCLHQKGNDPNKEKRVRIKKKVNNVEKEEGKELQPMKKAEENGDVALEVSLD